jgi:hypothetical protein
MDTKTLSCVGLRMWAAAALVTTILGTPVVDAQTAAAGARENDLAQGRPGAAAVMRGQGNMADHKQKMAEQEAMIAAADQRLADLVARMNAANGEDKVAAVAAVLNELVAQRKQMHQSCGMMSKAPTVVTGTTEPDHGAHHPEK